MPSVELAEELAGEGVVQDREQNPASPSLLELTRRPRAEKARVHSWRLWGERLQARALKFRSPKYRAA